MTIDVKQTLTHARHRTRRNITYSGGGLVVQNGSVRILRLKE